MAETSHDDLAARVDALERALHTVLQRLLAVGDVLGGLPSTVTAPSED